MKYVFATRVMIKAVLEEQERMEPEQSEDVYWQHPQRSACLHSFNKRIKSKYPDYGLMILASAANDGYLHILSRPSGGLMHSDYPPRVAVLGKGVKLLFPTVFINELGGSLGKVSPWLTLCASIVAVVISIMALSS